MTVAQLRASLKLWEARAGFRKRLHTIAQGNLDRARSRDVHPRGHLVQRRNHRSRQLKEARIMVQRRQKQIESRRRENVKQATATSGVTRYDGVPVAAVAVKYLQWARANG